MPNGKGTLDCCYCVHFNKEVGYPDDFGESKVCVYHSVPLPPSPEGLNRICCHFKPNAIYEKHNAFFWMPVARRFAWFGLDMEPGVLYEFMYNCPNEIRKLAVLREPDYEQGVWKPVK